ncbi:MAG: XdhC family protein [Thermoanaerobaculia bacterium]
MRRDVLKLAAELSRREEPFVLATVVRREPPSSAQPGDAAVVTASGEFHGWLGGSCTQPTVVREAARALNDGQPRLIALSPSPEADHRPGVTAFPMTCHSGGSVDIYVEPVLPERRLLVFGHSPVARALARLGKAMGFSVHAADREADQAAFPGADRLVTNLAEVERSLRGAVVVATMGEGDEEAMLSALALEPEYLGLVASRKRYAEMREALSARGASAAALDRVDCPAGLDIGAKTAGEIAVSILAGIVQKAAAAARPPAGLPTHAAPAAAGQIDPVCGMTVEPATARHRAEAGGRTYSFCCGGCLEKFLAAPERYAAAAGAGSRA